MLSSGKYLYQNLSAVTWICDLTVHADVGTCWRNPRYQRRPPPPPIIDSSTPQQPPQQHPSASPALSIREDQGGWLESQSGTIQDWHLK